MDTPPRKAYPTDVSDEEWEFVAPDLTLMSEAAPQRRHDLREVFNGLRFILIDRRIIGGRPEDKRLPTRHIVRRQTRQRTRFR